MRLLVISDIHANLEALRAVLKDADQQGFDQQICLGDLVGFGPHPLEVIRIIQERHGMPVVRGNWDLPMEQLRALFGGAEAAKSPASPKRQSFDSVTQWLEEKLTDEARTYLANLPETRGFTLDGSSVLAVHASPLDPMTGGLGENTPEKVYRANADAAGAGCVLHGHTHLQQEHTVGGSTFINPGSVGWPADRDPRACYALVEFQEGRVKPVFHRVRYSQRQVYESMLAAGLPNAEKILTGRSFFS